MSHRCPLKAFVIGFVISNFVFVFSFDSLLNISFCPSSTSRAAMDPPPDLSAFRGHFTEDTAQCGGFGSNGTSGPCPKRQRASGASSSDEVSSGSWFKGLFCAPFAKAQRCALLRAPVISPPLPPALCCEFEGRFWAWLCAFFYCAWPF